MWLEWQLRSFSSLSTVPKLFLGSQYPICLACHSWICSKCKLYLFKVQVIFVQSAKVIFVQQSRNFFFALNTQFVWICSKCNLYLFNVQIIFAQHSCSLWGNGCQELALAYFPVLCNPNNCPPFKLKVDHKTCPNYLLFTQSAFLF